VDDEHRGERWRGARLPGVNAGEQSHAREQANA